MPRCESGSLMSCGNAHIKRTIGEFLIKAGVIGFDARTKNRRGKVHKIYGYL